MYATAARNSVLKNLPDDQGVKAGGCAGLYFGGCAQLVVTNEGIIWSRGGEEYLDFLAVLVTSLRMRWLQMVLFRRKHQFLLVLLRLVMS